MTNMTSSVLTMPLSGVAAPRSVLGPQGWMALMAAVLCVLLLAPVLNMVVPQGSVFHLSDYAVALLGKIMCYAICALAMDLIWGYTGILSLGHGLFFALGGYGMGMYLMRQIGRDGSYGADLPDFMVFLDWKQVPWHWTFSESFIAQMLLVVLVPGLLAFIFGFFAFRSRIKGVYFSIITQAMTFAAMLLFFRNETVGGRATLIGPIIGAFFVNGAKSWFTQAFPEFWLYFLGALFILVTLYLPDGIVGGVKRLLNKNAEVKA